MIQSIVQKIMDEVVRYEIKKHFYVLRVKVLFDEYGIKCRVDVLNTAYEEIDHDREIFKTSVISIVSMGCVRKRIEKLFIDIEFVNESVNVRIQDWGIIDCPDHVRDAYARMGVEMDVVGHFDPGKWTERIVREGEYRLSAREILLNDSTYSDLIKITLRRLTGVKS